MKIKVLLEYPNWRLTEIDIIAHSYIVRVVLVIIMEFYWFIGHVL